MSAANAKIEATIRQIKEVQAEKEKTKEIRKELDDFKKKVTPSNQTQSDPKRPKSKLLIRKESNQSSTLGNSASLVVGANVRLKGQTGRCCIWPNEIYRKTDKIRTYQ